MGGYETEDLNSTEFLFANKKSEQGPTLDFVIAHHCMVKVSESAIYMVGGKQDGEISPQVWIADPTNNFEVKKGPSLQKGRYFHSCAVYQDSGVVKIVVAGGFGDAGPTNSVEILDPSKSNQWESGKNLVVCSLYLISTNHLIYKILLKLSLKLLYFFKLNASR